MVPAAGTGELFLTSEWPFWRDMRPASTRKQTRNYVHVASTRHVNLWDVLRLPRTTTVRMSNDIPSSLGAEELKALGNDAYKQENFVKAIECYKRASKLRPDQPVYLSNLSAAQVSPPSQYCGQLSTEPIAVRVCKV